MRTLVKSSNLEFVDYDEGSQTLKVGFLNKTAYEYYDVPPQTVQNLLTSKSVGSFFNKSIKTAFKFNKVKENEPAIWDAEGVKTLQDARNAAVKTLQTVVLTGLDAVTVPNTIIPFPKLYKRNTSGNVQEWLISVELDNKTGTGTLITTYGLVGGKLQTTRDSIAEGKNLGRANATSAGTQAVAEATSRWEKQKKRGYQENQELAAQGEVDTAVITGGIVPMLAQSFDKHAAKINYPAYVQPKLDGIRCLATIKNGKVTLWSRTRKPIISVPHIVTALEKLFGGQTITLDGELYSHEFRHDFEKIVSVVRKEKAVDEDAARVIEYHVYDVVSNDTVFDLRFVPVAFMLSRSMSPVKAVATDKVRSMEEVFEAELEFARQGYEGAIVRNNEKYESKRSFNLQKVKSLQDAEFPIVDAIEGRGKLAGHVGAFQCKLADGQLFNAKLEGSLAQLKEYFDKPGLWQGKKLTVQYQNLTKDGIPRFPVGKAIRDYE